MEKVTKPIVLNETFSEKLATTNNFLSSIAQSCETISAYGPKVTTGTSADGSTTITVENKDGTITTELVDGTARASVNTLSARMDTFTSLPEGSTSGNAELADIRVGANGTTYDTAGNAVRGQISGLKSDFNNYYATIIHEQGTNYIDKTVLKSDTRISELTGNETSQGATGMFASDFIPVEVGEVLYHGTGVYSDYYAYYDSSKTFISTIDYSANLSSPFTVPSGAYYIRVSLTSNTDGAWISSSNGEPADYKKIIVMSTPLNEALDKYMALQDWDDVIPKVMHDSLSNYIDKTKITTGYINANGVYTANNSLWCTDFIPVEVGEVFYHGTGVYSGNYYAFYDADKNVVSAGNTLGELTNPFTVPNDVVYGRFTLIHDPNGDDQSRNWIYTENVVPKDYAVQYYFDENMNDAVRNALSEVSPTDYDGMDIQAFDTCVCVGDSLTEGIFNYDNNGDTGYVSIPEVSYPSALQRMTGINVTNKGESGTTSAEWYTNHSTDDLSGHKFAIVQFGVNDVIRYGQGWTQNSINGYTNIINKLKADNQNIKIFVATVMPAVSFSPSNYTSFNSGLKSFIESLADDNVILLDMATYANTASQQYNAGHLSAYGYWRLAQDYANYISWYMHNNGMQFREIQFIGTDKHY